MYCMYVTAISGPVMAHYGVWDSRHLCVYRKIYCYILYGSRAATAIAQVNSDFYFPCILAFCIGVNAAGVRTPQYLTSRDPSMCWTPAILPMQSRVWCTIFVNIIDCMVGTVVEQVYLWVLSVKNTRNTSLKCFIFTSKCTKICLVAGLCPDPLGELTALLQTLS